jgi:hypothetical protein
VAFTTFGARPRLLEGAFLPGEPWVFASYAMGGLDSLNELVHETGHAVHIAAIRTRPAFMDWPDSDMFTEAVADLVTLEIYEPAWQRRYLGAAAPLADSIRAKYSGIVMDTAALFEIRMLRDPGQDLNRLWTDLTGRYLRTRPHPDLSWWAAASSSTCRHMLNYAAGAIPVADLRPDQGAARPDHLWRPGLVSVGQSESTAPGSSILRALVIEEFLGRPPSPRAVLDDLERARG